MFGWWGDYDRNQFKQDSEFHNVPFPIGYPHVNLKQMGSNSQDLPKRYGMAEALQLTNIKLEGTIQKSIIEIIHDQDSG